MAPKISGGQFQTGHMPKPIWQGKQGNKYQRVAKSANKRKKSQKSQSQTPSDSYVSSSAAEEKANSYVSSRPTATCTDLVVDGDVYGSGGGKFSLGNLCFRLLPLEFGSGGVFGEVTEAS
nr:hypothetical protein Iba_chr05aCG11050 [Ipomoea batatas]